VRVEGQTEPVAAQPGEVFPIPTGGQNTLFARNRVQEGNIDVAFTYLSPALPATTLNGTLLTVTFTAKQAVPTQVEIADLRVIEITTDGRAVDIPITFVTSTVLPVNGGSGQVSANCNFNNICDNALGESTTSCPADCPSGSAPAAVSEETKDEINPIIFVLISALVVLVVILLVMFVIYRRQQAAAAKRRKAAKMRR